VELLKDEENRVSVVGRALQTKEQATLSFLEEFFNLF
jgi:hypothetical protein